MIMILLIFIFGLIRFITINNGDRTTVTDFVENNVFGEDFTFDGETTDFTLAFGLSSYPIAGPVNLDAYGSFFATYTQILSGKKVETALKARPCRESDFGLRD